MFGDVAKMYMTPHKTHIRNETKAEFSHCGRLISGVAWYVAEYYLKNVSVKRPICKTCLRMFHKLKPERQQQGNKWGMV